MNFINDIFDLTYYNITNEKLIINSYKNKI